jgi:hypothetical protein
MTTVERNIVPLYMDPRQGLRFLVNGLIELLGLRAYLNPAPE